MLPGCGPKGAEKILGDSLTSGYVFKKLALDAYTDKFGEDTGIQKFYENYMLVKLRTDVPTDEFDLQEICRGYDLAKWDALKEEITQFVEEHIEEIPNFANIPVGHVANAVNMTLFEELKEFKQDQPDGQFSINPE